MIKWTIENLPLELKFSWRISRGETRFKNNFLIQASIDDFVGSGEVAFNIRYNENEQIIKEKFQSFIESGAQQIESIKDLLDILSAIPDMPSSLRFGIESAYIHLTSHIEEKPVPTVIRSNPLYNLRSSYSLPIMNPDEIEGFIKTYDLTRFDSLKIKLGHEDGVGVDKKIIDQVRALFKGKLRLDANEAFTNADEALKFIRSINNYPVEFLEQPLKSTDWEGAKELFRKSELPIFADESLTNTSVTLTHKECFHGVNIKLMKAGGYFQALKQMREAKKYGMKIMMGCMIESTLSILCALHLCGDVDYFDLDSFLFLSNRPFGLVEEDNGKLSVSGMN